MGSKRDGFSDMLWLFGEWVAFWIVLFYSLVLTQPLWMKALPESSKAHENDKYWCARNVLGIIHAALVSGISVPAFVALAFTSNDIRFASTRHLAMCVADETLSDPSWSITMQAVAMAGMVFTAFTLADVGISMLHCLATPDYILHHIAFISAGCIIRGNCVLPYNAAILLAMEVSTPSLNLLLLLRNRGDEYVGVTRFNGIVFVMLYVVFRLVINTYGLILLWVHRDIALPSSMPAWQAIFLNVAIAAGTGVQFFWFPAIAKTFGKGLADMCGWNRPEILDESSEPSEETE